MTFVQRPKEHEDMSRGIKNIKESIMWLSGERVFHRLRAQQVHRLWASGCQANVSDREDDSAAGL